MKVRNMTSNTGREVPTQFVITDDDGNTYFQSYETVIAKREHFTPDKRDRQVYLDENWDYSKTTQVYLDENWDYSKTTGKYRNQFLGETRKETERKIKDGTYIVTNLNG